MRAARLAEAPQQHRIGGFEEGDLGRNHAPHCLQNARQLLELRAFAHIHHQRGAADLGRLQRHLGEARNQFDGKVVDAVVAQILKGLEHGRFAGAAHPRDDDQFRSMRGIMRDGPWRFLPSARRAVPRFRDPDDFRGVMKWIVALRAECMGEIELIPYPNLSKSDLSKPGSDR